MKARNCNKLHAKEIDDLFVCKEIHFFRVFPLSLPRQTDISFGALITRLIKINWCANISPMNAIHLVVEQKPFTSHGSHTPVWCGANRSLPNPNKYSSVAHINYFDSNSTPRQKENSQIDLQCTPNCQSITTIRCARSLLQTTVKNSNGVYPVAVVRCYVSHTSFIHSFDQIWTFTFKYFTTYFRK